MKEGVDKKQPVKGPKKMDKIMSTKTLCVNTRRPTQSVFVSSLLIFNTSFSLSLSSFGGINEQNITTSKHTQSNRISISGRYDNHQNKR